MLSGGPLRKSAIAGSLLLVAVLAPVQASADPLQPRIDRVEPDTVLVGSLDTPIALEGDGFIDEGPDPARVHSEVWVGGGLVGTTVVDPQHITAVLPASLFEEPRTLSLFVLNMVGPTLPEDVFWPGLFVSWSNSVTIEVVEPPPPPPTALRIEVGPRHEVGSCFLIDVVAVDAEGEPVATGGMRFHFSSDDPASSASHDGGVTFYQDWCDGEPLSGPIKSPGDRSSYPNPVWVYASADTPGTVVIEVRAEDPALTAVSDLVRIAGGYLRGRVVADLDGAPVVGAEVFLTSPGFQYEYEGPPQFTPINYRRRAASGPPAFHTSTANDPFLGDPTAITETDGTFRTSAVPPGRYAVHFRAPPDRFLASEWYGDATEPSGAIAIEIIDGGDAVADASLGAGGTISGRVDALDSGAAVDRALVWVVNRASGRTVAVKATTVDGSFRTSGFAPGSYSVRFEPTDSRYLDQWFSDAGDRETAAPVAVRAGEDTPGIDASLVPGGVFAGTIRAEHSGAALKGYVSVFDARSGERVAYGYTDGVDAFSTRPGLRTGSYKLRARPYSEQHVSSWNGGASSFARAPAIEVRVSEEVRLDPVALMGASFTGTILGSAPFAGTPARLPGPAWSYVGVIDVATGELAGLGWTDSMGRFATSGVPAGTYRLGFDPYSYGDLAPEWFQDSYDEADAKRFTVSLGERREIAAILDPGGSISGRVTGAGGEGNKAYVRAIRDGEPFDRYDFDYFYYRFPFSSADAYTDDTGNFKIDSLGPGKYRLFVTPSWDNGGAFAPTWYPAAASRASATPITLGAQTHIDGITVRAGAPSFIQGSVDPSWAWIEFFEAASGERAGYAYAGADGTYRSPPLHAGRYLVKASNSEHAPEYFGGAPTAATAPAVEVAEGAVVSSVDIALDPGTRIRGSVRARHSDAPASAASVTVVDAVTGEELGSAWVSEGEYATTPLKPGSYKLRFDPYHDGVFLSQWYAGKDDFAAADPVLVTASGDTSGIDIALELRP